MLATNAANTLTVPGVHYMVGGTARSERPDEGPVDILVFLSGEREIRDTAGALTRAAFPVAGRVDSDPKLVVAPALVGDGGDTLVHKAAHGPLSTSAAPVATS